MGDDTEDLNATLRRSAPVPERLNADPAEIARLRRQVKALGPVNPEAIEE